MPAWSPEIANEFIRLGQADGRAFDQMQLQDIVYIAHGWCLAITGEPLTGDRPEAMEHGPEYRRLADALALYGLDPVIRQIAHPDRVRDGSKMDATIPPAIELLPHEREIVARVYSNYAGLRRSQLATLTRTDGSPWHQVFGGGAGKSRDIPHRLIRAQFAGLATTLGS